MILLFIGFQPGFSPTSAQPHFKCRETILSLLLVSYLALFHFLLPYWCCLMRCGLYRCVCLLLALLPWRKSQELVHDPLSPRSAYPSIISQQFILWLKVVGGWGFSGLCSSFPKTLARLETASVCLEAKHRLLPRALTGLLAVSLQVQPSLRVLAVQAEWAVALEL